MASNSGGFCRTSMGPEAELALAEGEGRLALRGERLAIRYQLDKSITS